MQCLDALSAAVSSVLEARRSEFDPWFYQYCGNLADPVNLETYVRHKSDLLAFARIDPRGAEILDAGAGFGLTLLVLAQLGATKAQGIEFAEAMVRTVDAYLPLLPLELRERVAIDHGDVMRMPYANETFDAVLSVEAISHYRDVDAAMREIHRVLRPGGICAIADGNNALNPSIRRHTREVWDAFELGAAGEVVQGHRVTHNYQAEREAFIAERYPTLPAERLARETFGMTFHEIASACESYAQDERLPGRVYDGSEVPTSPADGQVIERLFNPWALGRSLEKLGFDVRVSGYWGGASGRRSLRLANGVLSRLSRLTIFSAPGFRIAARKK